MSKSVLQHLSDVTIGETVVYMPSLAQIRDKTCIPKHTELVTHGRLADLQDLDDVVNAQLSTAQKAENTETGSVCEAFQKANGARRDLFARGAPPEENPPTSPSEGSDGPISPELKERLWS